MDANETGHRMGPPAWERGKGRMAERKRQEGKRQQDRGKGQAGRDQQGSRAQPRPPCFLAAAACDLTGRGVGMGRRGNGDARHCSLCLFD